MDSNVGVRGYRIRNQKHSESRRQAVLEAAARVFSEKGYAAATLDDIAEQIGLTKGVIYYYFRNKEDIYISIRVMYYEEALVRLRAIMARDESPQAKLRAVMVDLMENFFDRMARGAFFMVKFESSIDDKHDSIRTLRREYRTLVTQIIQEGIDSGAFADRHPRVTATLLLNATVSAREWFKPGGSLTAQEAIQHTVDQLLWGVVARP